MPVPFFFFNNNTDLVPLIQVGVLFLIGTVPITILSQGVSRGKGFFRIKKTMSIEKNLLLNNIVLAQKDTASVGPGVSVLMEMDKVLENIENREKPYYHKGKSKTMHF